MAGLGRKVFTRETLTSGDVNGYLMDQTVMRFASASARSTAIPSPTEGMITWLDDSNRIDGYDGGAWQPMAHTAWQYVEGSFSGSTDGGGTVTITHNLGVTPSSWFVQEGSSVVQHLARFVVSAVSSTQMQVVMYNTTNGATIGNNPANFSWLVYR
jgi:hypothetical protein